jgi:hypothetical protein
MTKPGYLSLVHSSTLDNQMKLQTAGPQWLDLPAPNDSDRPRLARELEALRLRNALDPKRFYRKDAEGSKREVPKYFAVRLLSSR